MNIDDAHVKKNIVDAQRDNEQPNTGIACMNDTPQKKSKIGYACAYTPLVLIDAAGYTPYRILPMSACPDQAGHSQGGRAAYL